jgi:hypothetical protein
MWEETIVLAGFGVAKLVATLLKSLESLTRRAGEHSTAPWQHECHRGNRQQDAEPLFIRFYANGPPHSWMREAGQTSLLNVGSPGNFFSNFFLPRAKFRCWTWCNGQT